MIEFLGLPHSYGTTDCITLVINFYKHLGIHVEIPTYTHSRRWIKETPNSLIHNTLLKYTKKVNLTEIKNYDLIVFSNKDYINHFAVYLDYYKMLHIEEQSVSKIERLDDYWINNIYGVFRPNELV